MGRGGGRRHLWLAICGATAPTTAYAGNLDLTAQVARPYRSECVRPLNCEPLGKPGGPWKRERLELWCGGKGCWRHRRLGFRARQLSRKHVRAAAASRSRPLAMLSLRVQPDCFVSRLTWRRGYGKAVDGRHLGGHRIPTFVRLRWNPRLTSRTVFRMRMKYGRDSRSVSPARSEGKNFSLSKAGLIGRRALAFPSRFG